VSDAGVSDAVGVEDAPVPESAAVCGLPLALSATLIEAVRVPLTVGLNVTLIVHVFEAGTLLPQVFVCEKSPRSAPVIVTPLIVSAVALEFESVIDCAALAVLSAWLAKVSAVGASVAVGVPAAAPVPDSVTDCGLPVALSAMETDALRAPLAVGLKVTLIVQLAEAATLDPQVLVCEKSPAFVPPMVTPLIVNAAAPVFDSVITCAALDVLRA
jgi:hypothetical protein